MKFLFFCLWSGLFFVLSAAEIQVMSYNVENLFDNKKDKGKNDWTYLPNGTRGKKDQCAQIKNKIYQQECYGIDWTDKNLEMKLNQIAKVIEHRRKKPELLALVEVENDNVVSMLAKKLGYPHHIVTESPDRRGVDVALLYNDNPDIKKINVAEHELTGGNFRRFPTRNILEVEFKVKDKFDFILYVNHWPSQGAPAPVRVTVAEKLRELISKKLKAKPDAYIMAVGDYNTIPEDRPHPFRTVILRDNFLYSVHDLFRSDRSIDKKRKQNMPPGTYFYPPNMSWNVLDEIFINEALKNSQGMYADYHTYEIFCPEFITTTYEYTRDNKDWTGEYLVGSKVVGVPMGYDHAASNSRTAGFSDHFPVAITIRY